MKIATTLALGIALGLPALATADDKKELEKLQGTWKLVSYEVAGTVVDSEEVKQLIPSIVIKGDTVEFMGGMALKGKAKLDSSKTPKQFDVVVEPAPGVSYVGWGGVYVLDGDTLKYCIGPGESNRPKDLSTKGTPTVLLTLKRAKP